MKIDFEYSEGCADDVHYLKADIYGGEVEVYFEGTTPSAVYINDHIEFDLKRDDYQSVAVDMGRSGLETNYVPLSYVVAEAERQIGDFISAIKAFHRNEERHAESCRRPSGF